MSMSPGDVSVQVAYSGSIFHWIQTWKKDYVHCGLQKCKLGPFIFPSSSSSFLHLHWDQHHHCWLLGRDPQSFISPYLELFRVIASRWGLLIRSALPSDTHRGFLLWKLVSWHFYKFGWNPDLDCIWAKNPNSWLCIWQPLGLDSSLSPYFFLST